MWCDLRKPVTWCKIVFLSYWYHVKVRIILFPELFTFSVSPFETCDGFPQNTSNLLICAVYWRFQLPSSSYRPKIVNSVKDRIFHSVLDWRQFFFNFPVRFLWYDQAKSVLSWGHSILSFLHDLKLHHKSYILLKTPSKSYI